MTNETPKIVELPAFKVVGLELTCTMADTMKIPALWTEFGGKMGSVPQHEGIYGVCLPAGPDPNQFRYLACARVADNAPVPEGMQEAQVPAAKYAVYPFKGKPEQMGAVFGDIYGRRLAAAGLTPANGGMPCLELYAEDCMDEKTGELKADLYIAVE